MGVRFHAANAQPGRDPDGRDSHLPRSSGGNDALDPVNTYFECITACSIDDGECVTQCVEVLRATD
jgi:hypothetical protein